MWNFKGNVECCSFYMIEYLIEKANQDAFWLVYKPSSAKYADYQTCEVLETLQIFGYAININSLNLLYDNAYYRNSG